MTLDILAVIAVLWGWGGDERFGVLLLNKAA
jgi:hypothetical protein